MWSFPAMRRPPDLIFAIEARFAPYVQGGPKPFFP